MSHYDDVIQLILTARDRVSLAESQVYERERAIRIEYDNALRSDPLIIDGRETAKQWNKVVEETMAELFTPGILFKYGGYYYVVEFISGSYIYGYRAVNPPSRSKRTDAIKFGTGISIIQSEDIEDIGLRKAAEKLITRVRTKDWKTGDD